MTINIKNVTFKNFLSVGAVTQSINLDQNLTLILGENLDLGGSETGSKNGTGKTTLLNALSYGLYGQALTNIKKENLINMINGKGMLVTVNVEIDQTQYRIERGRKPNVLKFYINNKLEESEDESQGDSRDTQKHIENILGISHTMFKHLVALNTYTEPFLSMRAADQRDVIEQLLGITLLSQKSEKLKELIKETKNLIQAEQYKIDAIKKANETVENSIKSLELKSSAWNNKYTVDLNTIKTSIDELKKLDIDQEIDDHEKLNQWTQNFNSLTELKKQKTTINDALKKTEKTLEKYLGQKQILLDNKCPTCLQGIQDHNHQTIFDQLELDIQETSQYKQELLDSNDILDIDIKNIGTLPDKPTTFYESIKDVHDHKNNLDNLEKLLGEKLLEKNPYEEQIQELKTTAIQPIIWSTMNDLTSFKDHQDFLLKLLTNKDSFIRKKIINQNLTFLNKRLVYYIEKIGLPHTVIFENDLSVSIRQLGQDMDFDNLSRGERNRLILALSLTFRDVWENLYQNINLLFIDELIDSGLDAAGVESSLAILKKIARERNKNIYLISHREELVSRVDNILKAIKSNGFTSYENNYEK
jgi:DNA repair exonuclease SbcCD ATPase subunit